MKKGFYKSERMAEFREMFPNHSNKELAVYFQLSICTIKNYAYQEGLFKSAEYLKQVRTIAGRQRKNKLWKESMTK